jgi:hypothetical protein
MAGWCIKPKIRGGCWGGSRWRAAGCCSKARPGRLTCARHADQEEAAKELKARLEAFRKGRPDAVTLPALLEPKRGKGKRR